jgi:hypothetical protein
VEKYVNFFEEKKKTKKLFFCGKNRVNPLRKKGNQNKNEKAFFCGKQQ